MGLKFSTLVVSGNRLFLDGDSLTAMVNINTNRFFKIGTKATTDRMGRIRLILDNNIIYVYGFSQGDYVEFCLSQVSTSDDYTFASSCLIY